MTSALHARVGGEPAARPTTAAAVPARVVRRGERDGEAPPGAAEAVVARSRAQHPPPDRTGGDGGGTTDHERAAAHRAAAVVDEGRGVGRVALAGQQVLDDGVEVDVERPVGGFEPLGGPRPVVGGRRAGRAARCGRSRTSATGIPSRSATSSGPARQTDPAPIRARSSGVAPRTTASRAVSTGSSSSGSAHGS